MGRNQALALLRQHKAALVQQFAVSDIAIFGSTARDEASDTSDIDILVRFDGPTTTEGFFGLQFYLEDLFDCRIDLVTDQALRKEFRAHVEQEAIHA